MKASAFSLCFVVFLLLLLVPASSNANCIEANDLSSQAARASGSKAIKLLNQAIKACPESVALRYNLAVTYFRQGRNEESIVTLEKALDVDSGYAPALNSLAYMLVTHRGDYARAKKFAQRAVEIAPANASYQETLALTREPAVDVDTPVMTNMHRPYAVAVVMGIRNYANTQVPAVEFALHDAEVVKEYLIKTLGYREANIIYLPDATKTELLTIFGDASDHRAQLHQRIRKGQSDVFVFYSGHGAPDTNTGEAYLVPSDANPASIKFTGYSVATLKKNLTEIALEMDVRSLTVVLDACFSGGAPSGGTLVQSASPIFLDPQMGMIHVENAAVLTSSSGKQVSSWYTAKQHGMFTYFFLKALNEAARNRESLTIGRLETALTGIDSVRDTAWLIHGREQEPVVQGNRDIVLIEP